METSVKKQKQPKKRRSGTISAEERENQLIAAAVDLAEKQILEGTASSAVLVHFLKLATQKEKYELEMLKQNVALAEAKTENLQSVKSAEELLQKAIGAFTDYRGNTDV